MAAYCQNHAVQGPYPKRTGRYFIHRCNVITITALEPNRYIYIHPMDRERSLGKNTIPTPFTKNPSSANPNNIANTDKNKLPGFFPDSSNVPVLPASIVTSVSPTKKKSRILLRRREAHRSCDVILVVACGFV
jgi:negative regulator of sigma E activity